LKFQQRQSTEILANYTALRATINAINFTINRQIERLLRRNPWSGGPQQHDNSTAKLLGGGAPGCLWRLVHLSSSGSK
jgi:hypothetical protein